MSCSLVDLNVANCRGCGPRSRVVTWSRAQVGSHPHVPDSQWCGRSFLGPLHHLTVVRSAPTSAPARRTGEADGRSHPAAAPARVQADHIPLAQLVELKNGETFNGHLVGCDNFMNLTLKEVYQTSAVRHPPARRATLRAAYAFCFGSRTETGSGSLPSATCAGITCVVLVWRAGRRWRVSW